MHPRHGVSLLVLAGLPLLVPSLSAASELRVRATLTELPRAPRCEDRVHRVTTRYRVDEVLAGQLSGRTLLVVHKCPEYARGPSKYGKGEAGPLKVGQTHRLTLEPAGHGPESPEDRFVDSEEDRRRVRYAALRTDPAPRSPRIAVVFSGGIGSRQRLDFDAEVVSVGRATDSDVLLHHSQVAPRHLLLEARDDRVMIRDLGSLQGTKINGRPIRAPQAVTASDRVEVGPYTLHVSIFLPEEIRDDE
jgi:hypothetical protein